MKFKKFKQQIINNPESFSLYDCDEKGLELLNNLECNSIVDITLNITMNTSQIIGDYLYFNENPEAVLELKKCKTAKDFIKLLTKIHLENGIQIDNYIKDYKLVDIKFIDYEKFKRIN